MSSKLLVALAGAIVVGAQPPADFEASVKAHMAPSLARQRAAVQKQASLSGLTASSFFAKPFPLADSRLADCDPLPAEELDPLIEAAAQKAGVDAQLVRAVIDKESGGRPCAISPRGAQGLMQLMPETAEEFEIEDAFDPKQNVETGARLLKILLQRYQNDPALALGAYNAGPARVDQDGGVPKIPETMDYVSTILEKLGVKKSTQSSDAASTDRPSLKDF